MTVEDDIETDGVAVASDSAVDAFASVCVTFDDADPVVVPKDR